MILRQRMLKMFGMKNYDVCDEAGKRIYLVEQQLCLPRRWEFFDLEGQRIAGVKKGWRSICLVVGGEKFDTVRKRFPRRKYRFVDHGWRVTYTAFCNDFIVRSPQGTILATGEGAPESRELHIDTVWEKDMLPVLLFAVATGKSRPVISVGV